MTDLAHRFEGNPIIRPLDVPPSRPGLRVACVLNPGAFRLGERVYLVLRVAEAADVEDGAPAAISLDPSLPLGIRVVHFPAQDSELETGDPRQIRWRGATYLTTISHLRIASSQDGIHFEIDTNPMLEGEGSGESWGVEDCRVTELDGEFHVAYTAVSPDGFGVGSTSTADWRTFCSHGMILPPPNKDCALFGERVGGDYLALHRPVAGGPGGKSIWLGRSPDLVHWGRHQCIVRSRHGYWDSARVGAGAPPIRIPEGWLELYHGADDADRYCLGALLLDARDPSHVLGRSREPIMAPTADYERKGFYGNVVFTDGVLADGDQLTVYYGAADECVCGATMSIREILSGLE